MEEIWKDVVGYEGFYMISNLGRVKSLERVILGGKWGKQKVSEKILKNCVGTCGYLKVCLNKNGKRKNFDVHRLVGIHFLENKNNFKCLNHKDENKSNNFYSNLEWCTHKYNNEYNGRNLLVAEKQKGKKRPIISLEKHPRFKNIKFYEKNSVHRSSFIKKIKKINLEKSDFEEIFDNYYYDSKGRK